MNRINVVQIGIGHDHATAILDSLLRQPNIFDVVALAVPEGEKTDFADRIAAYAEKMPVMTVDEVFALKDIDAVIVETEEENLTKYAYVAIKKGLPVHMDKPGGVNFDDFAKLINLAKEKNIVFHISDICIGTTKQLLRQSENQIRVNSARFTVLRHIWIVGIRQRKGNGLTVFRAE